MGSVRKFLHQSTLPPRESHHSRMFIDLAENIHIHHREYRTVFSLPEYFEYAEIVNRSTQDVRNYLEQNDDYQEGAYPTTLMIAGGSEQQLKFLTGANQSAYYDGDFAIELQDEYVTDEIHIHYRDFRIALSRENFKEMAAGFTEAVETLTTYESENEIKREQHHDHVIEDFNASKDKDYQTKIMGVRKVPLASIGSHWYQDLLRDWEPNARAIKDLRSATENATPVLLSIEADGRHLIVDGHHRVYAALKNGSTEIDAVVMELTFQQTEKLRQAEDLLKAFDQETNFTYGMTHFYKSFLANRLNTFYRNSFSGSMLRQTKLWKFLRQIKAYLFGHRSVFRSFNEKHNQ